MKKAWLIVLLSVCTALLVSCGDGTAAPSHTGEYLDALASLPASDSAVLDLSEDDTALIAHLVSLEAGDLPYETQVCFAAMVLNRIADPGFPATARGVVFDSGDFSSVVAGRVNGTLPPGCTASKKYRTALKAVKEALSGSDPTGGALYFAEAGADTSYAALSYEARGMTFGK